MIKFLERVQPTKQVPWMYDVYEIIEEKLIEKM